MRKSVTKSSYFCDRCKKEYLTTDEQPDCHSWTWTRNIYPWFGQDDPDNVYDLCDECRESFRKWKNDK